MEQSLKREQARIRKQRQRDKERDIGERDTDSVTSPNVGGVQHNPEETVPASYVEGINGKMYEVLPERPRYLKLSDGQVLDRLNQPEGNKLGFVEMMRCNESYNYRPSKAKKST